MCEENSKEKVKLLAIIRNNNDIKMNTLKEKKRLVSVILCEGAHLMLHTQMKETVARKPLNVTPQ